MFSYIMGFAKVSFSGSCSLFSLSDLSKTPRCDNVEQDIRMYAF